MYKNNGYQVWEELEGEGTSIKEFIISVMQEEQVVGDVLCNSRTAGNNNILFSPKL